MNERQLGDGIAKQELNLIFAIDVSGSMDGEKIGAVNDDSYIFEQVLEESKVSRRR